MPYQLENDSTYSNYPLRQSKQCEEKEVVELIYLHKEKKEG